jgi:hypothetical protein
MKRRPDSTRALRSILVISALSMVAGGCSSTKGSDSSVVELSTAPTDSTASSDSTVSAGEQIPAASDTTLLEPSIAVGEPNPASGSDAATEPSADSVLSTEPGEDSVGVEDTGVAAPAAGPSDLTDEQLKSAFSAMGIPTTPEKLTCVKEKAGKTDMSAPEPPPEFLRALMSCVPESLAEANGQKLSDTATKAGATTANAKCFQEKTFETMAATDIATFTKLLDANAPVDFPADIKANLKENTKACALTEAQFLALLQG